MKRLPKPQNSWKVTKQSDSKESHQEFGNMRYLCCIESSMSSLLLGVRQTTTRYLQCSHHYPVQKQREKSDYSNYQGITLFSITRKVPARILLNMLVATITEEPLPESQCGIRPNKSTTNMMLVFQQLQEKYQEQNKVCNVCSSDESIWYSE